MFFYMVSITNICLYKENSIIIIGYQIISRSSNLLPVNKQKD